MERNMKRKGFTFLREYYDSLIKLSDKQRLKIYDVIVEYSFSGDPATFDNICDEVAEAVLLLMKPRLDDSLNKFKAGTKGGKSKRLLQIENERSEIKPFINRNASKTEADNKQNNSKTETDYEQNISATEAKNSHCASKQGTDVRETTVCKTTGSSCSTPLKENNDFDDFWEIYPRKVGKGVAKKIWGRIKPTFEQKTKILDAIRKQKKSLQRQRDNGQYIPNPSTWLNESRWDDELPERVSSSNFTDYPQRDYSDEYISQFVMNWDIP